MTPPTLRPRPPAVGSRASEKIYPNFCRAGYSVFNRFFNIVIFVIQKYHLFLLFQFLSKSPEAGALNKSVTTIDSLTRGVWRPIKTRAGKQEKPFVSPKICWSQLSNDSSRYRTAARQ